MRAASALVPTLASICGPHSEYNSRIHHTRNHIFFSNRFIGFPFSLACAGTRVLYASVVSYFMAMKR
jgi:hypothetical protein